MVLELIHAYAAVWIFKTNATTPVALGNKKPIPLS